jgi:6-phosphogluconolactonase
LSLDDEGRPQSRLALMTPPASARGEDRSAARPRPHASLPFENGEFLVTDAGRDLVILYRIDGETAEGVECLDALPLPPGCGPRHLARLPGREIGYVSNQNAGSVSVIARVMTGKGPRLELRSAIAAPGLGRARSVPSEIAVHPGSGFVYMANRMDNSLSIFSIESEQGDLAARGSLDVMGANPRHFALSPDGKFLIVANQDSDDLTTFAVSDRGGRLEWTGKRTEVATPTAICF